MMGLRIEVYCPEHQEQWRVEETGVGHVRPARRWNFHCMKLRCRHNIVAFYAATLEEGIAKIKALDTTPLNYQ